MEAFGDVFFFFFRKRSHGCVGRRSILIERSFSDLAKVWKGVPWQKGRGVMRSQDVWSQPKPPKQRNLLRGVVSKLWTSREPTQITESFLQNCETLGWNVVQYRLWLVWLSWNPRCFHILLFQKTHANIQAVLDISFEVCNSNMFFFRRCQSLLVVSTAKNYGLLGGTSPASKEHMLFHSFMGWSLLVDHHSLRKLSCRCCVILMSGLKQALLHTIEILKWIVWLIAIHINSYCMNWNLFEQTSCSIECTGPQVWLLAFGSEI